MSKKVIFSLVSLTLMGGLGWYFLSHDSPVKNTPLPKTGPILFFGDSLVEGIGATAGHDLPTLLEKSLGEPVQNYGVSGDTTKKGFARLEKARREKPRLVLILLGGNDFLQKVPRKETFENLEKIVRGFQSDGTIVVLIGVRSGIVGGGADSEYEALAEKTGSRYVEDVLKDVFGNAQFMSDSIHPNDQGYEKIAERLIPVVRELLTEK